VQDTAPEFRADTSEEEESEEDEQENEEDGGPAMPQEPIEGGCGNLDFVHEGLETIDKLKPDEYEEYTAWVKCVEQEVEDLDASKPDLENELGGTGAGCFFCLNDPRL